MSNKLDLSSINLNDIFGGGTPEPEEEQQQEVIEQKEAPQDKPEPEEPEQTPEVKDETESAENEEDKEADDFSVIKELSTRFGVEIDKEYAEDIDGVASFAMDVANKMAAQQLEAMFRELPDVQEYMDYRLSGGDPNAYFEARGKAMDVMNYQIGDDDVASQKEVVSIFLREQGFDATEIRDMIADYEDSGILKKHAEKSLGYLKKTYETKHRDLVQRQQEEARRAEEAERKTWEQVAEVVKTGAAKGIVIPEMDKRSFWEWMTKPVDNRGYTQRMLDREKMDYESTVALEYLAYKGIDFNKLIQKAETTKKTQALRDKLKASKDVAPTSRMQSGKQGYKPPVTLPSLSEIFK